jgi:hypothetical protein
MVSLSPKLMPLSIYALSTLLLVFNAFYFHQYPVWICHARHLLQFKNVAIISPMTVHGGCHSIIIWHSYGTLRYTISVQVVV